MPTFNLSQKVAVLSFGVLLFAVTSTIFLPDLWDSAMQAFGFDLLFAIGDWTGISHRILLRLILSPILIFGFSFILALPIVVIFRVSSLKEAIIYGAAAVIGRHVLYHYASIEWFSEDVSLVMSKFLEETALVMSVIVAVVLWRKINGKMGSGVFH